ncbi:hypothetical protein O0L34_g6936 [Tuta absoluta]|nr:hypothetical protein O0L34_g6936 [Tuta absoluta]
MTEKSVEIILEKPEGATVKKEKSEDAVKKEPDTPEPVLEPAKQSSRSSKQVVPEQIETVEIKVEKPEEAPKELDIQQSVKQESKISKMTLQNVKETELNKGEDEPKKDTMKTSKLSFKEEEVTVETKFEKREEPSKQELVPSTSRIKMRRQSYEYNSVMGLKKPDTSTAFGLEFKRPFLIYEPTYQTEPLTRFKCSDVEKIINTILDSVYDDHIYHVQATPALAISIANRVMKETKALQFNRYRILCVVVIGQKRQQCYTNTVCFLWDKFRDAYVDVDRENFTTFIQVTVFGIYLD